MSYLQAHYQASTKQEKKRGLPFSRKRGSACSRWLYLLVGETKALLLGLLWGDGTALLDPPLLVLQIQSLLLEGILHFLVLGVELGLGLCQLGLLLLDLLLEDVLHVLLHLHELGLVQGTLLLQLGEGVDLSEDGVILLVAHGDQLLRTVVLVVDVVGELAELLHVGADQHLTELDEVAVVLVVDLNDTPWVLASTDMATISSLDNLVRSDNGEGDLALFGSR